MNEVKNFSKVQTISKTLNAATGSTIVTIYENTKLKDYKLNLLSKNGFIKNLKCYAKITSLAEATLPSFAIDDSETDKLYKTLNVEWGSARKQLNLYISNDRLTWQPIGAISLLNPSGYPYRIYNLLDIYTDNIALEVGINGRIGVNIQDVGYGLLGSGDSLTIFGSYLEEVVFEELPPTIKNCTSYTWTVSNNSQIILPANPKRTYAIIANTENQPVYLSLGNSAITGGIPLLVKGGAYELTLNSGIFQGTISAICPDGTSILTGIECN